MSLGPPLPLPPTQELGRRLPAPAPLKARAEAAGSSDFSLLWSGQAASLGREIGAGDLTRQLAADAEQRLKALASTALGWGGLREDPRFGKLCTKIGLSAPSLS